MHGRVEDMVINSDYAPKSSYYVAGDILLDTGTGGLYLVTEPTNGDWYYVVYDFKHNSIHPIAVNSTTDMRTIEAR